MSQYPQYLPNSYQMGPLNERGRPLQQGAGQRTPQGGSPIRSPNQSPGGTPRQPCRMSSTEAMRMAPRVAQTITANAATGHSTPAHQGCWEGVKAGVVAALTPVARASLKVDQFLCMQPGTTCTCCGRTCATAAVAGFLGGVLIGLDKARIINLHFDDENRNGTSSASTSAASASAQYTPTGVHRRY